jgi:1,2-phenylacetyl-CoA epoxidase PaaB subunit
MKKVRYRDYEGQKRFRVSHPDYQETVDVYAPEPNAALCAAADHWQRRWQDLSFYSFAIVSKL